MNYLMKYKGVYRLLPELDKNTNDFIRDENGNHSAPWGGRGCLPFFTEASFIQFQWWETRFYHHRRKAGEERQVSRDHRAFWSLQHVMGLPWWLRQ